MDALNGQAAQEFDADGNRTALVDPNNNRQEFSYDLAGRLTGSSSATGSLQYTYNQLGVLGSFTNGRGQTRSLQYDDAGRPITQSDPDGTINCTYDANGNLLTVTDASGTITRQYDALNRVTSYTDARGNTLGYAYDAVGNLTCLTYPDGKQVNYSYDAANRLTQVTDWAGRITTYTYDANNRLIQTNRPDGSIETRTYDAAGRLTQQLDKDQANNTLTQFDFAYNAAGNVTTETNNLPDAPMPEQSTMTYTTDNRLETCNGQSVSYDADGNMTSGPLNGQNTNFTFDSRNRLTAAGITIYGYDAENNRISIADSVYQATYVINPNASLSQVLIQTDGQGNQTFYVYGLGLIGEQSSAGYKVYHYDLRGSMVMLTDINGTTTDTYQYCPYGELLNHTGTSTTPFQYNGQYGIMNDGNGLYYMRARYYNPEIKRFMSRDSVLGSITKPQSLNRYGYCNSNPTNLIDPTGHRAYTYKEGGKYRVHFGDKFIDAAQDVVSFIPGGFLVPHAAGLDPITDYDLQELANAALDVTSVVGRCSQMPLVKNLGKVAGNLNAAMNAKQLYDDLVIYNYDLDRLIELFLSDVLESDSREGAIAVYSYAKIRMKELRDTGKVGFTNDGEGYFGDPNEIEKIKEEIWSGNVSW